MRVPRWVRIVLEGGAIELERAFCEYRLLARRLRGPWQSAATQVVGWAGSLAAHEAAIEAALDRAERRVLQGLDGGARGGHILALVTAVRRERTRVAALIDACFPLAHDAHGLGAKLLIARDAACEEALVSRAWRQFRFERGVLTLGTVAALIGFPAHSWWIASGHGYVPTLLDWAIVLDSPSSAFMLVASGVWAVGAAARFQAWRWLGPSHGTHLTSVMAAVGLFGGMAFTEASASTALALSCLGGFVSSVLQTLWSAWRPSAAPLNEVPSEASTARGTDRLDRSAHPGKTAAPVLPAIAAVEDVRGPFPSADRSRTSEG
jgi:hypothetical protein